MNFYDEFMGVVDALADHGLDYAVCGGVAVAIHGFPRFTKDIDLLIQERDLEAVLKAVAERGFSVDGGRIPFRKGKPDEQILYRVSKFEAPEHLTLDLILVGDSLESIWSDRLVAEWHGREIQVVSKEGLARMKRVAGRSVDRIDLERLESSEDDRSESPSE